MSHRHHGGRLDLRSSPCRAGAALAAARADADRLPLSAGVWQEVTNQRYNANPAGFEDPVESNVDIG